jgi:hypothetical protein
MGDALGLGEGLVGVLAVERPRADLGGVDGHGAVF